MAPSRNPIIRAEGGTLNWFKLHHEVMFDSKVQTLPPELFRAWINVLCMASANKDRGYLPDIKQVAYVFHSSREEARDILDRLVDEGLLVGGDDGRFHPHNWEARQGRVDLSTERSKRFREKKKATRKEVATDVQRVANALATVDATEVATDVQRDATPLEKIREEEIRGREEESLSNDNDSGGGEVVANGGTFRVISAAHRQAVEYARAQINEEFAAAMADRGSEARAMCGGDWRYWKATIDDLREANERIAILKPWGWCVKHMGKLTAHGIPTTREVAIPARKPPEAATIPINVRPSPPSRVARSMAAFDDPKPKERS